MNDSQLELGFGNLRGCQLAERRVRRAHWWFERMRQLVDRAMDWPSASLPRPEQLRLPAQPLSAADALTRPANLDERQICA